MLQAADPSAMTADQIYRAHSGFVWRLVRARGIPTASIPDVLQEIFVTVLRRLPTYQEMGTLKGWLYTIADGHIRQFFRSEGRRERRMTLFAIACSITAHTESFDLDAQLTRTEATRLVQRFMDDLPKELREIFLLCAVEGLSGVEVARLLGVNINTLYSREAAARRRFHAFVQQVQTCTTAIP